MPINIKAPRIFLVGTILIFLSLQLFAQPRGMTMNQVYNQLNKQDMNMRLQRQLQMMNMPGVTGGAIEFDFQIMMLDSTKKEVKSAIYTDAITYKRFIVWIDKRFKRSDTNRYKKIFPSQTLSLNHIISAPDDDNPGKSDPAKITDSCWMFKELSGAINLYTDMAYNYSGGGFQDTYVGIQLNNGSILPFNEANLKNMVGQNAKALELIADKKYLKAIKRYNSDNEKVDK